MEMYLVIGHEIGGLYYNLLNKDQWTKYEELAEENDNEKLDCFLDSGEILVFFSCTEFVLYVNQNNIKLIDGDSYLIN